MLDRLLACALILVATVACRSAVQEETEVKVTNGREIDARGSAIVKLKLPKGICTGTFVNPTTVLSAAHCVDRDAGSGGGASVDGIAAINFFVDDAFFTPTREEHVITSEISSEGNRIYDVAVFVFPPGTGDRLGIRSYPVVANTSAQLRDQVTIVGYGDDNAVTNTGSGILRAGENTISAVDEHLLVVIGVSRSTPQRDGRFAASAHGDSGGPLLDDRGAIVGIVSGGGLSRDQVTKLSYFVNATGPAARTLFRFAIQCRSGRCAANFPGSGLTSSPASPGAP